VKIWQGELEGGEHAKRRGEEEGKDKKDGF